ncbi:MAG: zf-HC2 domain-containing protein [Acidobacteriota bacterium]
MNRIEQEMQSEHAAAFAGLPWYVNETLQDSELQQVERHLATCVVCRSELAYQRKLSELIAESEDFPLSSERGWQEILQRIETEDSRSSHRSATNSHWLQVPSRLWRQTTPGVRGALLVQAAAILLLVGFAVTGIFRSRGGTSEPSYHTLSKEVAPVADSRFRIQLVFVPDTPEIEVRSVVASIGGDIVAGPSPLGVYTVATTLPEDGSVTGESLLIRLREYDSVVFAEPATPGGAIPGSDSLIDPAASRPDHP